MVDIKINAERAGRVKKPARSIEIFDPETGIKLGTVSFQLYGSWSSDKKTWCIHVSPESNTRLDVDLEKTHSPELVAGGYGGPGGFWRWDPSKDKQEKRQDLIKTVERITGSPVEVVKVETRLQLDDPEWWELDE